LAHKAGFTKPFAQSGAVTLIQRIANDNVVLGEALQNQ
jgi:hypothetical protein